MILLIFKVNRIDVIKLNKLIVIIVGNNVVNDFVIVGGILLGILIINLGLLDKCWNSFFEISVIIKVINNLVVFMFFKLLIVKNEVIEIVLVVMLFFL